jgi:hypothetical protein
VQEDWPAVDVNVPSPQSVADVTGDGELGAYEPAGASVQDVLPDPEEKDPAAHFVGVNAPVVGT